MFRIFINVADNFHGCDVSVVPLSDKSYKKEYKCTYC